MSTPQTKTKKVMSRCCRCLKLKRQSKMYEWWSDEYCPACTEEGTRCERCNEQKSLTELRVMANDISCTECIGKETETPPPPMKWYAVSIFGREAATERAIKRKFTQKDWRHRLGKIVIPRVKQARTTTNKYKAWSGKQEVGTLYAIDSEEALKTAKGLYERRAQGAYKPYDPSPMLETYKEVVRKMEKDPLTKRNRIVWEAVAQSGKVLGRLLGIRGKKAAEAMAKNLYEKRSVNGRDDPTRVDEITHVTLEKQGGKTIVRAKKSMAGYMIVQMEEDREVLDLCGKASGVRAVLPYRDKMTEKELDSFEFEHGEVPWSVPIKEKEVEEIVQKPIAPRPVLDFAKGDKVRIIDGAWKGTIGKVEVIEGLAELPDVVVRVPLMGQLTNVRVRFNQVMKV